jgi:DegV family protein with EDD domain
VINSGTITGGLGLIVLRLSEAIEDGATHEDILPEINKWVKKTQIRVTVPTLKYIIRSGRVSAFKGFIARALDLKPVIVLDEEGKTILSSKSFTEKASMKKVISGIRKITEKNKIWAYSITHASNVRAADWYAAQMEEITGMKPEFISAASPALGTNTGPGVTCISFMLE